MANRGVCTTMSCSRRKSRRIESKAGSSRSPEESHERSHLLFIKFDSRSVPHNFPDSSTLTRKFLDTPLTNVDKFCNGIIALDRLSIRVGENNELMWNDHLSPVKRPRPFFCIPADNRWDSRWSPLGSYFVTGYPHAVIIWGSKYYMDFGRIMRFNHYKVEQFDLSPGEKYLVTYNKPEPSDPIEGLWLKIFDVTTGKGIVGLNAGVADSPKWPVIRWAGGKDDKYFAILSKNNTISVYETETFSLLGQTPLNLDDDDVVDISWSPTESYVLALLLKGVGGVKALLLRIPGMVKLADKDLVGDCKMHWQSNGEYLAVNTYSGFEFFRLKEEGVPTDFLKVDKKKILAFAWEPSGHRFAVIHGDEPNLSVSFYSMETPGKVTELLTLRNKQTDALFWSPRGKLIVLAGLGECFNGGLLEFFDVDKLRQITTVQQDTKVNHVAWDASGRHIATGVTIPKEEFDSHRYSKPEEPLNRFTIWTSHGVRLYQHQCEERLIQLDWCPYGGTIDDDTLKMQKNPFADSSLFRV